MKESNVRFIDDDAIITLTGDDGVDEQFYGVAIVHLQQEFFIVMQPAAPIEGIEDDEALIFKVEVESDSTDLYTLVQDTQLANAVFDQYLRAVSEEA